MFTNFDMGQYVPLALLSLALDYRFWGLEAAGYHLTSVLWHAAAAVVWFGFWRRLFERFGPKSSRWNVGLAAAFAALTFVLHPLRVESVAWVSERRDVVCGFFYAVALRLYLEHCLRTESRGRWLAGALAAYVLSLLAKATSLTLPATLLILDVYPLRRVSRKALLEKVPFAGLSLAAAVVTMIGAQRLGALEDFAHEGLWARLARASYGALFYPGKTLWPTHLLPIYELPTPFDPLSPRFLFWMSAAACATALVWRIGRRVPAVGAAAAHYAVALLPMSGLIGNGAPHLTMDRFAYLPSLAFSGLFGAGLLKLLAVHRRRAWALAGAAALLTAWGTLSWRRCRDWHDDLSLWRSAVASTATPGPVALNNLAASEAVRGDLASAESHSRRALNLDPASVPAWGNLAAALDGLGKGDEAEAALRQGLASNPASSDLSARLSGLLEIKAAKLSRTGEARGARRLYEEALAADATNSAACVNLGLILDAAGRRAEARRLFERALKEPELRGTAHADWGNSLLAEGKLDEAAAHYEEALRLDPGLAPASVNLGNILARRGRYGEAAARYRAALKKDPGSFEARVNLSAVERLLKR